MLGSYLRRESSSCPCLTTTKMIYYRITHAPQIWRWIYISLWYDSVFQQTYPLVSILVIVISMPDLELQLERHPRAVPSSSFVQFPSLAITADLQHLAVPPDASQYLSRTRTWTSQSLLCVMTC